MIFSKMIFSKMILFEKIFLLKLNSSSFQVLQILETNISTLMMIFFEDDFFSKMIFFEDDFFLKMIFLGRIIFV